MNIYCELRLFFSLSLEVSSEEDASGVATSGSDASVTGVSETDVSEVSAGEDVSETGVSAVAVLEADASEADMPATDVSDTGVFGILIGSTSIIGGSPDCTDSDGADEGCSG